MAGSLCSNDGVGAMILDTTAVKVSAKMMRLEFNGCEPDYIRDVCHAKCCDAPSRPTGMLVTIHPTEQMKIEDRGASVVKGLLQPSLGTRGCPFKSLDHLCTLHFTDDKPFGCIASPFTLTPRRTLIVRNRYKLLPCYKDGKRRPAYEAFRTSLDLLFGHDEASRICFHLEKGGGDLIADMLSTAFEMLYDNDKIKRITLDKPA